ncbi:MAG TPA: hypothetical protein VIF62_25650 [Labilithrix sp.]
MRAVVALILGLGTCAAACSKCGAPADTNAADAAEAAVPAPADLLADVYVSTPNTSWGKLQRGVGGAIGILPPGIGGMVCTACGMDFSFADEIDGTAPAYGVIAGDPADPSWVLALKLVDFRRARGALVGDDVSRFTAKELGDGITEIVPKQASRGDPHQPVAITKNGWMVVAKRSADLPRLAPYVTRTLSTRPLPEGSITIDVPRVAIDTIFAPKLDSAWTDLKQFLLAQDARMRREHGGRAPDYGDPQAIVAGLDAIVSGRLAVVHDLDRVRLTIDVADQDVTIAATLAPAQGGGAATKWIDGMKTGDASAVLRMPSASALAFASRDSEADRAAQAAQIEKTMTEALGARVPDADQKRIHDAVDAFSKSRGDVLAGSVVWDDPRAWFVRFSATDAAAADRALRTGIELTRVAPFSEMLHTKEVAIASEDAAGLGKASVATITRTPPPSKADAGAPRSKGSGPDKMTVAWISEGGALDVAYGEDARTALALSAKPEKKLDDEPSVKTALAPLGDRVSTVLVAQPLRFDPKRANLPVAPVVVGVGRQEKNGFVRVDVSDGVLREVTRFFMGL